jgi:hypothetical protein
MAGRFLGGVTSLPDIPPQVHYLSLDHTLTFIVI